jgi:hypothetical protein
VLSKHFYVSNREFTSPDNPIFRSVIVGLLSYSIAKFKHADLSHYKQSMLNVLLNKTNHLVSYEWKPASGCCNNLNTLLISFFSLISMFIEPPSPRRRLDYWTDYVEQDRKSPV